MRYAEKHARMAAALAHRTGGITAKELAWDIGLCERLCLVILGDIARRRGKEFVLQPRPSRKPGPAPLALVARSRLAHVRKEDSNGTESK